MTNGKSHDAFFRLRHFKAVLPQFAAMLILVPASPQWGGGGHVRAKCAPSEPLLGPLNQYSITSQRHVIK